MAYNQGDSDSRKHQQEAGLWVWLYKKDSTMRIDCTMGKFHHTDLDMGIYI